MALKLPPYPVEYIKINFIDEEIDVSIIPPKKNAFYPDLYNFRQKNMLNYKGNKPCRLLLQVL